MIKGSKRCLKCDRPSFSKGFCQYHYKSKPIKTGSKKIDKTEINSYFDNLISKCYKSDNSGLPIQNPNRSNIAHILPKRNHRSVADNEDNYLFLTFKEHERFDYLLFSHKFKEIEEEFPKLMIKLTERLRKILPLCEETTPLKIAIEKWIN